MGESDIQIKSWRDLFVGTKWIFLGLALVIFLVFANSLENEFVSDDIGAIVNNPNIDSLWLNGIKGRTVSGFVLALVHKFSGTNPLGYHLNNTLWHFGNSLLVYLLVFLLAKRKILATIAAFLFALHPIHTEAVTWVSGLPYLLYSFFGLAAFLVFVLVEKGLLREPFILLATLLVSLALFSSEKAIVLPVIFAVYVFLLGSGGKSLKFLWPIFLITGLYFLTLLGPLGARVVDVGRTSGLGGPVVFNPLEQIPLAIPTYLKVLLLPTDLTFYHESFVVPLAQFYVYAAAMVIFLVFLLFLYLKNKFLCFAGLVFLLGLGPTLLPIQISWIVAERYVYFSSWGFLVIIAYGLLRLKKRSEELFWLVLIGLLTFYGLRTFIRNLDWKSQDTLWPATVAVSPGSSIAHNNMGDYYARHGDLPGAIREFTLATQLRPNYADAIHNLGNTYMQMGEATTAAKLFEQALSINPQLVESAVNLAALALNRKDYNAAGAYLQKAQSANPNSPFVYNAWAVFYAETGDKEKAIEMLRRALFLDPKFEPARKNLELLK